MYWIAAFILFLIWYLGAENIYKWSYIIYRTLPRDIEAAYSFIRVNYLNYKWERAHMTLPKRFMELLAKHPNRVAFYFEDDPWTYKRLDDFSNRVANYFIKEGFEKGQTVALLLENRPEYVGLWLGLSKAGIVTALINTNLVSASLHHCISVANSQAVIFGSDFTKAIDGINDKLQGIKLYRFNTSDVDTNIDKSVDLRTELQTESTIPPSDQIANIKPKDKIIYIFTSGTTGLPKAAVISHGRFIYASSALYVCVNLNEYDIFYDPLPLYHSSGGMIAVGQSLLFGISVVIRRKFSASNFWTDCVKYKCTAANYIGEICRYLLATHKNGINFKHKVRKMAGNGMRREIWKEFMEAFNVPYIYEFYASTEGNCNLVNIDNTVGAAGFIPAYASSIYPITIIKCDEDTKEPIRDRDGRCIRCKTGESGILVGKIVLSSRLNEFAGYVDNAETQKKILKNVFTEGDSYFNTGDMMLQDELGYFYFKDRTGDTFRWKGENVATTEIETILSKIIGLEEAVVYGVEVPGNEGRAGMIAVVDPEGTLDKEELAKGLSDHLPSYAIPLFLRITESLPMTGTFKVKKVELQKQGFDINSIKDPIYFYEARSRKYIQISEVYEEIMKGTRKL